MNAKTLGIFILATALAGCGAVIDDASKLATADNCAFIGPGAAVAATVDSTCLGCTVTDSELAADGDEATAAAMKLVVSANGGAALRATAPPGVVFDAGRFATVIAELDRTASIATNPFIFVRTYLAGTLQEEGAQTAPMGVNVTVGRTGVQPFGFQTSRAFDAIEFAIGSVVTVDAYTANIYEFCSSSPE